MPSVLIRDVPDEELEVLRAEAAARGQSLQAYLLAALHDRTRHARRQATLRRLEERLEGGGVVGEDARRAVLAAMTAGEDDRGAGLAR